MTIREIPRSFEYECDGCGSLHVQHNAGGHYTNSRPPEWFALRWIAPSMGMKDILLCDICGEAVQKAINSVQAKPV